MVFKKVRRTYQLIQKWFEKTPSVSPNRGAPLSLRPVLHENFTQERLQTSINDLQTTLVEKGFQLSRNGLFDRETRLAVEAFQRDSNLKVDGIVGPLTWAALLYPTLSRTILLSPELEVKVRHLQERLLHQERLHVRVDGVFGARTERALKRFQRRYGLHPDGICGPLTWLVLLGQQTAWDGEDKSHSSLLFIFEQLLIIISIFAGISFSPVSVDVSFPILQTLIIAYGLSCLGQPFIEYLFVERLMSYNFPLMRYAPYVLMGFLWQHVLQKILNDFPFN